MALGTVKVTSRMPIFPATIASAASRASSAEGARTIGTKPTSRIFPRDVSLDQDMGFTFFGCKFRFCVTLRTGPLPCNPQAGTFEQAFHFCQGCPVKVAGHGVFQGAEG